MADVGRRLVGEQRGFEVAAPLLRSPCHLQRRGRCGVITDLAGEPFRVLSRGECVRAQKVLLHPSQVDQGFQLTGLVVQFTVRRKDVGQCGLRVGPARGTAGSQQCAALLVEAFRFDAPLVDHRRRSHIDEIDGVAAAPFRRGDRPYADAVRPLRICNHEHPLCPEVIIGGVDGKDLAAVGPRQRHAEINPLLLHYDRDQMPVGGLDEIEVGLLGSDGASDRHSRLQGHRLVGRLCRQSSGKQPAGDERAKWDDHRLTGGAPPLPSCCNRMNVEHQLAGPHSCFATAAPILLLSARLNSSPRHISPAEITQGKAGGRTITGLLECALVLPTRRRPKESATLTAAGLACLLSRLDPDIGRAGIEYERLRGALTRFFDWRGAWPPEECADETLDRLARRLEQQEEIADLRSYAYGIARLVLLERRRLATARSIDAETLEGPKQERLDERGELRQECFDRCLAALDPDTRSLVMTYYSGERQARIATRQRLGSSLNISENALRSRVQRVRDRLAACVEACLSRRGFRT